MRKIVSDQLYDINGRFYQEYGAAFAETRRRIQPGVRRILAEILTDGAWLDLGCGSGALSAEWVAAGKHGLYEGLDFSPVLIERAQTASRDYALAGDQQVRFALANLCETDWPSQCSLTRYDGILMFAALHHIPGAEMRTALLQQIARLLPVGSLFIHSEWQFTRNPKLAARILPWSRVGLSDADVEAGDYLLDWRHTVLGQEAVPGLRYVHLFSVEDLAALAAASGFTLLHQFDSDGATGDLSLYQVWQRL
jgi:SAM-dependent methyltransferase